MTLHTYLPSNGCWLSRVRLIPKGKEENESGGVTLYDVMATLTRSRDPLPSPVPEIKPNHPNLARECPRYSPPCVLSCSHTPHYFSQDSSRLDAPPLTSLPIRQLSKAATSGCITTQTTTTYLGQVQDQQPNRGQRRTFRKV